MDHTSAPRAKRPNAVKYQDPRPAYIKSLILAICRPMPWIALRVGVSPATLYRYTDPKTPISGMAPYPVQVLLEILVINRISDERVRNHLFEGKRLWASSKRPRAKSTVPSGG